MKPPLPASGQLARQEPALARKWLLPCTRSWIHPCLLLSDPPAERRTDRRLKGAGDNAGTVPWSLSAHLHLSENLILVSFKIYDSLSTILQLSVIGEPWWEDLDSGPTPGSFTIQTGVLRTFLCICVVGGYSKINPCKGVRWFGKV